MQGAASAQRLWRSLRIADRARYMQRAAQAVIDEADELTELLCREQGRPRAEAELMELVPAIETLQWLAAARAEDPQRRADRVLARACTPSSAAVGVTSRLASSASSGRRRSRSPRRWATPRSH